MMIAGVDEVGRGPLAGPVVTAAVILPDKFDLPFLTDSKKLTPKRRLVLEKAIKEQALCWSLAQASIEEIDAAWELRDSGFHFAWPTMDAMYSMGMEDVYSTINAMMSKAGQKYISPRQFLMERKKEGAKEFLGELSI